MENESKQQEEKSPYLKNCTGEDFTSMRYKYYGLN